MDLSALGDIAVFTQGARRRRSYTAARAQTLAVEALPPVHVRRRRNLRSVSGFKPFRSPGAQRTVDAA
jgi:hypothetical protein